MTVAELIFDLLRRNPDHEVVVVVGIGPFGEGTVVAKLDPAKIWSNTTQLILRGERNEKEDETMMTCGYCDEQICCEDDVAMDGKKHLECDLGGAPGVEDSPGLTRREVAAHATGLLMSLSGQDWG